MTELHQTNNHQAILSCRHICKTYHDGSNQVNVIDDLELDVYAAEHLAIVGSSGSGKSTLLHIMGALDKPSSGDVIYMGQNIHQLSDNKQADFRNQNLGFIYQFHHLLAEFSAIENVAMPRLISGQSKEAAFEQASELLKRVGLGHRIDHRPSALSGGERQRVAIARALINQPKLVLADEPTGNLDHANAQSIFALIQEIREQFDTAFVFVTHDLELAARMDRQLKLSDGKLHTILESVNG
ncbi:lipoprotein-releasing ABC transporter ATP-binding protein LolD [Saccharobesus litoralis]|uniref:Lipoprotein-releasing system ATP-binding protein LolD n=1 Tax=Saccharobesus litoralis TaxID=2172099 RepID=A0A2S0VTA6_9ALTE|nr:lipoprotein-releasing ABC transporter ATP-binding protein LolD [Saccharobesus litoralis]AWB67445.1 lipoprotein-releasing ABC transporter ATP-binding protein LolD [Saccharobesus litoralis]